MTDLRKAAEKLLQILDNEPSSFITWIDDMRSAREELRQALAQPEQEPVAWLHEKAGGYRYYSWQKQYPDDTPLYTAPPKREWVGLTDEEFEQAVDGLEDLKDCWTQIEAKLKEKNT